MSIVCGSQSNFVSFDLLLFTNLLKLFGLDFPQTTWAQIKKRFWRNWFAVTFQKQHLLKTCHRSWRSSSLTISKASQSLRNYLQTLIDKSSNLESVDMEFQIQRLKKYALAASHWNVFGFIKKITNRSIVMFSKLWCNAEIILTEGLSKVSVFLTFFSLCLFLFYCALGFSQNSKDVGYRWDKWRNREAAAGTVDWWLAEQIVCRWIDLL